MGGSVTQAMSAAVLAAGTAQLLIFAATQPSCLSFVLPACRSSSSSISGIRQAKARPQTASEGPASRTRAVFRRPRPQASSRAFHGREGQELRCMAAESEEAVAPDRGFTVDGGKGSLPEDAADGVLRDDLELDVDEQELVGDQVEDLLLVEEADEELVEEFAEGGAEEAASEGQEEEEEEEEEVDPMAEVKEQIKALEKELQDEDNKLADIREGMQEKGQMGFLRMAAQVDNFRKTSGKGSGEYEADAKAAVLRAMLPALTPFEEAEEKLELATENEKKFHGNYQALYRQLKERYAKLGATDFFGVVGEKFIPRRHEKLSEEHNDVIAAGDVIECVSPGLELRTNVIRKAVCVVSLGPEKTEAPEESQGGKTADGEELETESEELRDAGDFEAEAEGAENAEEESESDDLEDVDLKGA